MAHPSLSGILIVFKPCDEDMYMASANYIVLFLTEDAFCLLSIVNRKRHTPMGVENSSRVYRYLMQSKGIKCCKGRKSSLSRAEFRRKRTGPNSGQVMSKGV